MLPGARRGPRQTRRGPGPAVAGPPQGPLPRIPVPRHCLLLRAGWSARRLLRVRLCLPLTSCLCVPLRGVPLHPHPSSCSRVLVLESAPAGLGWALLVLCGLGATAQPEGRVPASWGGSTGAWGLAQGRCFPRASPALCGLVPLALLPWGKGPARASRPSPSCGPHPVGEPRCLCCHCRPTTRWLMALAKPWPSRSRVPVMVGTPCSGPLPHVSSQPHVPTGHTGSWRSAAAGAFVMQSQGCYKRKLVPQSLLSDTHQSTAPRGRTPRETGASAGGSMPPGWWAGQ